MGASAVLLTSRLRGCRFFESPSFSMLSLITILKKIVKERFSRRFIQSRIDSLSKPPLYPLFRSLYRAAKAFSPGIFLFEVYCEV